MPLQHNFLRLLNRQLVLGDKIWLNFRSRFTLEMAPASDIVTSRPNPMLWLTRLSSLRLVCRIAGAGSALLGSELVVRRL